MKNRRVSMSLSRTVSDGNFGSYKATISLEADIDDNEDLNEAYDEIYDEVFEQLEIKLGKLVSDI